MKSDQKVQTNASLRNHSPGMTRLKRKMIRGQPFHL